MAKLSRRAKFAMGLQVFLLRRGWMGRLDDFVMIITTTGRKTGRKFTTPIAYQRDGNDIIALNPGTSNWFHNVSANGEAIIEIKRQVISVTGAIVKDEQERQRIFGLYHQTPATFERLFKLPADSPEVELQQALAKWQFVKFKKK